jgi:thiol-disulfide isomerase/thioredoxin
MKDFRRRALLALAACAAVACGHGAIPGAAPEFTHTASAEWINSGPLTLAALRGKVVLVEFWAFECVNCLNSRAWVESVARSRAAAGLVVVGVHTPELPAERQAANVRRAVAQLGIRHPVMLDDDYSYWNALGNQYWPAFYFIGRDGLLHGSAIGELHSGTEPAKKVEALLDELLKAPAPH